jgi:hypothetical protein
VAVLERDGRGEEPQVAVHGGEALLRVEPDLVLLVRERRRPSGRVAHDADAEAGDHEIDRNELELAAGDGKDFAPLGLGEHREGSRKSDGKGGKKGEPEGDQRPCLYGASST